MLVYPLTVLVKIEKTFFYKKREFFSDGAGGASGTGSGGRPFMEPRRLRVPCKRFARSAAYVAEMGTRSVA